MNSGVPRREMSSENAAAARTPFTGATVLSSVVEVRRPPRARPHGAALGPLAGAGEPVTEPP